MFVLRTRMRVPVTILLLVGELVPANYILGYEA